MTPKWKTVLLVAAILLLAVVLLTEGVLIPRQIQGDVLRVRLVGLSQTEEETRATFELRNVEGPKVDLWNAVLSQPQSEREIAITPVTLEKGDAATIELAVPTEGKWQVLFYVNRHPREEHEEGTIVYSEWIDSTVAPRVSW